MCDREALITFPTPRKIKVNASNYCNVPRSKFAHFLAFDRFCSQEQMLVTAILWTHLLP